MEIIPEKEYKLVVPSFNLNSYVDLFGKKWKPWLYKLNNTIVVPSHWQIYTLYEEVEDDEDHETSISVKMWSVGYISKYREGFVNETWLVPYDSKQHLRFIGLCDECGGICLHEDSCLFVNS